MALMAEKHVSVVTNPASNMKLGNGFAPVPEMVEAGINVCLGTDGAASNNSLNMFHEMSLLSLIHKGTHDTPVCIGAGETLDMATVNGAKALGLDNTGAIKEGYKADLAILDINTPSMMPHNSLLSSLTYSANGSEVDTTIVDGEILMEGRELKTIDLERVFHEVNSMMERLKA
jgi:5-methylthioadenosine/S-adenosylhomocysteine deaminase